ncbi:MAG: hypothetical protein Kow00117_20040 [Phototrophicales bacterium]
MLKRSQWLIISVGLIVLVVSGMLVFGLPNINPTNSVDETNESQLAQGVISPSDYQRLFTNPSVDHLLIDVRTPEEFAAGHIQGAVNIPLQVLDQYVSQLPDDQPIVVYCRSGNRSATAFDMITRAGFTDVYDIQGGTNAWVSQGLPLQN